MPRVGPFVKTGLLPPTTLTIHMKAVPTCEKISLRVGAFLSTGQLSLTAVVIDFRMVLAFNLPRVGTFAKTSLF